MASSKNKVDPKTYAKNVVRSMGYISKEAIKGVNPSLSSYIADSVGTTKDMFQQVRDFTRSFSGKLKEDDNFKDLANIGTNIKEDLRTGKFYNPEREKAAMDSYMEREGFSFDDFDLDFDDDDSDGGDKGTVASISAMDRMSARITSSQQNVTAYSTEKIVKGNAAGVNANMLQNRQLFGMVNTSLASINGSILSLHEDLAKPLNNHITNSTQFFQFATGELAKQTAYLEKISNTLENRFGEKKNNGFNNSKKSAWEEVFGNGLPDLGALGKSIKHKAWDQKGLGVISDFVNPETLATLSGSGMLSSPIAAAVNLVLPSLMENSATGKAAKRLEQTLKGGFAHTAARIGAYNKTSWTTDRFGNRKAKNGFLSRLADIFDITPKKNNKMSFGEYEKGRVDWTGMDDKALREVIPTQLANILAAVTGEEAKIYNYKTGKWETAKSIGLNFKKERSKNISNSMRDFSDDVVKEYIDMGNKHNPGGTKLDTSSRATKSFKHDYDSLMELIAIRGINPATLTEKEMDKQFVTGANRVVGRNTPGGKQYLIDQRNYTTIKKIIFKGKNKTLQTRMSSAIMDAQLADNRFVAEAGKSEFGQVANGSGLMKAGKTNLVSSIGNILNAEDDTGHSVYYYLQSYWKQLDTIKHYVETGNVGGQRRGNRGRGTPTSPAYQSQLEIDNVKAIPANKKDEINALIGTKSVKDIAAQVGIKESVVSQYIQQKNREDAKARMAASRASHQDAEHSGYVSMYSREGRDRWNANTKGYEDRSKFKGTNRAEEEKKEKSSPISRAIDKVNGFLGKLFVGEGMSLKDAIEKEGGLFGYLKALPMKIGTAISDGLKKTWEKLSNWFKDKFMKDDQIGGKTWKSAKEMLSGFGKDLVEHAKSSAGKVASWWHGESDKTDWTNGSSAARGGIVKKSGMVSVSEGEMIIPSEYNPLYKGSNNKARQKAIEKQNYRKWVASGSKGGHYWGSYAEGGNVVDLDALRKKLSGVKAKKEKRDAAIYGLNKSQTKAIDELKTKGKDAKDIAEILEIDQDVVKDYILLKGAKQRAMRTANAAKRTAASAKDKASEKIEEAKNSKFGEAVKEAKDHLFDLADKAGKNLFGDPEKYGKAKDLGKTAMDTIKANLPKTLASAGIGALIGGALTGSGLGLLGGMVIGAGTMVIKNSDKISETLFGKQDKQGNYEGTKLIPAKAANFIKKRLPSLAKSGALGGILGTIGLMPGGILGGLVIGAGVDLLAHNENVKNGINDALFGKMGADGKRRGGIFGVLKANIVDPISEYVNGAIPKIGDYFKENFIQPVINIFNPLKDWVKGKAKSIGNQISDAISNGIKNTILRPFGQILSSVTKPVTDRIGHLIAGKMGEDGKRHGGLMGLVRTVGAVPGKILNKAGENLNIHNIKMGYSSKDVSERVQDMKDYSAKKKKNIKYNLSGYNEKLLSLRDEEGGQEKSNEFARMTHFYTNGLNESKRELGMARQDATNKVLSTLDPKSPNYDKDSKALEKLLKSEAAMNGDFTEVYKYLDKIQDYDEDRKKSAKDVLSESSVDVKKKLELLANYEAGQKDFFTQNQDVFGEVYNVKTGKVNNKKLQQLRNQAGVDVAALDEKANDEWAKTQLGITEKIDRKALLEQQNKENPLDSERNSLLSKGLDILASIGAKIGIDIKKDDVKTSTEGGFKVDQNNVLENNVPDTETEAKNNAEESHPIVNAISSVAEATHTGVNPVADAAASGAFGEDSPYKNGDKRQNPNTGDQEEYRNGKWVPDLSDAETKERVNTDRENKSLQTKFYSAFLSSGLITSLTSLFGGNKKEDKSEKKETLLDKIKNFFGGEDGIFTKFFGEGSTIGKIVTALTGSGGIVSTLGSILSSPIMSTVLGGAAGAAVLTGISNQSAGTSVDDNMKGAKYMTDEEKAAAKQAAIDKQQNMNILQKIKHGADSLENKVTGKDMTTYKQDDFVSEHTSNRVNKKILTNTLVQGTAIGAATNAITGKMGVVGNLLNPAGLIKKTGEKILKVAKDPKLAGTFKQTVAEKATEIIPCLKDKVIKVISWACQKLGIKGLGESADDIALKISSKLAGASSKLAEVVPIVGWVIYGVQIVNAITVGIQSAGAKVILGILDEPTTSQKLLAALANGINAAIPGIGGIIPTETIVSIIYNVLSKCGVDFGDYAQQRENAQATLDQYNEENGTTYNLEEYLYNVQGQATIQNKIKHEVVDKAKSAVTAIKETGSNVIESIKDGSFTTKAKEKITGLGSTIKSKASSALTTIKEKTSGFVSSAKEKVAGIGKAIAGSSLVAGAKTVVSNIKSSVSEKVDYVKDAVSSIKTMQQKMGVTFANPESGISDVMNTEVDISEDNPLSGIVKSASSIVKVTTVASLLVGAVTKKIYNKYLKPVIDTAKTAVSDAVSTMSDAIEKTKSGDVVGLLTNEATINESNPVGIISHAANFGAKYLLTPVAAVIAAGKKIKEGIEYIKQKVSPVIQAFGEASDTAKQYALSGDISGLWAMDSDSDEENPLGGVSKAVDVLSKMAYTPVAAVVAAGNKIKEGINSIKEKVSVVITAIGETGTNAKKFSDDGDVSGLWAMESNSDGENPLGVFSNITDFMYKVAFTPTAVIHAAGNKINELFTSVKDQMPDIKSMVTDLWSYTDPDKDMSGYNSTVDKYKSSGGIGGVISSVLGGVLKPFVYVVRAGKTVSDAVGDVVDGVSSGVKSWVDDKASAVTGWVSDKADSLKSWAQSGSGSGVHVSQKTSNRKFGNSTLSANGCGPAAAATVLRAYGKDSSLTSAANFAEANGYVAGASNATGTRASYFGDILGSNGIGTSYTQSKSDISKSISSGKPAILLGQDKSNRSKTNSPFGPNPHYVVARGSDSRGNIVVDDPELNRTAVYNKNILNKTKLGVLTGGASDIPIKESDGAVWNYLKSAGLNDYGTAGLMGNLYAESGITFNKVEGASLKPSKVQGHDYSSDHGFTYDSESYTTAVDKGLSQGLEGGPDSNAKPTFGVVPKYEFTHMPWQTKNKKSDGTYWGQNGYGLVQWTTAGRKEALYNLAKSKGKSISDPETQLEYLVTELNGPYAKVMSTLKSANSVRQASDKVLIDFESPSEKNEDETQRLRSSYGEAYYNKFTKEPPTNTSFGSSKVIATANIDTTGMSTSGTTSADSTSTSTTDNSTFNLSSILSNRFGKVFEAIGRALGGTGSKILSLITGGLFGNSSSSSTSSSTSTSEDNTNASTTASTFATSGETNDIVGEKANGFPLFLQADSKWGSIPYGSHGTIASSGCGPSSMAMVLRSYGLSNTTTPEETASWSASNGYRASSGTSWGFFKAMGNNRGLTVEEYGPDGGDPTAQTYQDKTKEYLSKGIPVIGSMRPGHFTKGGHFIVFTGIDDAGNIYVNDPSSKERSSHAWLPGQSLAQAKEFWAIKKSDGTGSLSKNLSKTAPSTLGSRGGSSGLPLYDFTKADRFKGGATGLTSVDTANVSRAEMKEEFSKQLAQILLYIKQIASNTGYNASIPTLVEVMTQYGNVLAQLNNGSNASATATEKVEANIADSKQAINDEISGMIAKLDAIAASL